MTDLIDTGEMYLKTIYELEEEKIEPLRARIVERLGHSGPTVSETVARLERDKWLVVTGSRRLQLTEAGWQRALRVIRRHRLAERLLLDVIGLDWHLVDVEACRWEHVMSQEVEQRLIELLKRPQTDPFGNPIPYETGGVSEENVPSSVGDLVTLDDDGVLNAELVLRRIGEPVQVHTEILDKFFVAGMLPGAVIRVIATQAPLRGTAITAPIPGHRTIVVLADRETDEVPEDIDIVQCPKLDVTDELARHLYAEPR